MDTLKMLTELRAERTNVEEAIAVLERLARGQGKRRGRPPLWLKQAPTPIDAPRKRKPFSAATRRKMQIAQRKRRAQSE